MERKKNEAKGYGMEIKNVMVVGAGIMGSGIAQACMEGGADVLLVDASKELAEKGKEKIEHYLKRKVEKGKLTEEQMAQILPRLRTGCAYEEGAHAELVIEAVPENVEIKQAVFRQLEAACDPDTILATNTSTISITRIASVLRDASRVIGMHFFVPASVMKLVEVIPGLCTSDSVKESCMAFAQSIGKTPILAPDTPGFTVNRLLVPMWNEAAYMVMEGVNPKDIDTAMKLGGNLPMGPLELADYAGLDTVLATMTQLYLGFNDCKYRPCPLLQKMVYAGRLGRKSGKGFYDYT